MIRIGIIGCGYWGPNYLRNLHFMEGTEVRTVCDHDLKSLKQIQKQYPLVRTVNDYSEVLGDNEINAVIIATPASTHYELTQKALLAGKHVLVEKPLALKSQEARELVDLAKKSKKVLMVGHTFLFNPAIQKMKEYIDRGDLGKIYYLQATRTHLGLIRHDVSALWDLAPHDIAIFYYLLGKMPKKVSAIGASHLKQGIEDVAFVNLVYDDNVIGNIHISWVDSNKMRKVAIIGSKARIVFDDLDALERLRIYEKGISIDKPYSSFGEFQLLLRDGDIISPKVEPQEPLRNVCIEFLEAIRNNRKPLTDGMDGLRVVETMCAIQESISKGGEPVNVAEIE